MRRLARKVQTGGIRVLTEPREVSVRPFLLVPRDTETHPLTR